MEQIRFNLPIRTDKRQLKEEYGDKITIGVFTGNSRPQAVDKDGKDLLDIICRHCMSKATVIDAYVDEYADIKIHWSCKECGATGIRTWMTYKDQEEIERKKRLILAKTKHEKVHFGKEDMP